MPRERDPPYVAAGFRTDAVKLLEKFIELKTLRFPAFAEVWRELNFSTIFMGRETLRELHEFIEECYRNTLLFMDTSNLFQKVGAVYLLYSLYLKQPHHILKEPVMISVTVKQVNELNELERHFLDFDGDEGVQDLTYVINKLFKMEAIRIAYVPIPMGPVVPISLLKLEPMRSSGFKEALGMFSMLNNKEIMGIEELSRQYQEARKKITSLSSTRQLSLGLSRLKFAELNANIKELEDRYNAGLLPNKLSGDVKLEDDFRSLGHRRAMLKAQQYEKSVPVRVAKRVRASSESSRSRSPPSPRKRGRPKRKNRKKRGRKKQADIAVRVKVEPGFESPVEADIPEEEEEEEEEVDNPGVNDPSRPAAVRPRRKLLHPRRPSKFPRPIRRHYFDDS